MKTVLIIAEFGVLNGGEQSLLALLPHLLKSEQWNLIALVPPNTPLDHALNQLGIHTLPFSKIDEKGKQMSQTQFRNRLAEQIDAVQPELIHCNSLWTSRSCGPVAKKLQIPSVGYLRDILNLTRKSISDLNQIDCLVAVSQATREYHINQGLDEHRVCVVYNGVNLNQFSPTTQLPEPSIHDELSIDPDAPLLLFVGQLSMRKGIDILVETFIRVAEKHNDCHLLIVGERNSTNPEAFQFEKQCRAMASAPECPAAIASRIHWLGRRDDVATIMRQSAILIHPAWQEPLGRVLLESAASGLPLVTTDVGGSAEVLQGMEDLRLLHPVDTQAVGKRCLELLKAPEERETIAHRLRKMAETRFADTDSAHCLATVYHRTLAQ